MTITDPTPEQVYEAVEKQIHGAAQDWLYRHAKYPKLTTRISRRMLMLMQESYQMQNFQHCRPKEHSKSGKMEFAGSQMIVVSSPELFAVTTAAP